VWTHKESNQSEHKAIEGGQVRGSLSGAIADDKLLLEQQGFRGERADAARAKHFGQGDEQVDGQEEQIAHEMHVITPAQLRKTAPQGLIGLHSTNSPCTGSADMRTGHRIPAAGNSVTISYSGQTCGLDRSCI